MKSFEPINRGFNNVFQPNQLSIGIVVPIEHYPQGPVPSMKRHLERILLIEQLGFAATWVRDVPFHVPSFGDAGQTFDPFTYLGYLAGQTSSITLGVASIALPLHHPVHVAKFAATTDQLSNGRFILGVATGDRYDEYPAMGIDYESRAEQFREAFNYIRKAQHPFPRFESSYYGNLNGKIELLPKPTAHKIPLLITGSSRQSTEWNARNGDGWMYYPRNLYLQQHLINDWRTWVAKFHSFDKPFMQPLYIDLQADDDFLPQPIHLGLRIGIKPLTEYLNQLQAIGVNHVAINLRFNTRNIENTLKDLSNKLLPHFRHNDKDVQFT